LGELKRLRQIIKQRQKNAKYLIEGLKKFDGLLQLPELRKDTEHAFMLFPILVKNQKLKIEKLLLFLEKNGIETRFMFPVLNQPIYKKMLGNIENQFPVAKKVSRDGFLIGCHQDYEREDLDYIISVFESFFRKENL
jgi:dTDP-4-amino-4,6-dideoxygalactose transaminase